MASLDIENITSAGLGGGQFDQSPALASVDRFTKLLDRDQGKVMGAVVQAVERSQEAVQVGKSDLISSVRNFDAKDDVMSLINVMHESSKMSVFLQLAGKASSKTTEGFESLIKQQ